MVFNIYLREGQIPTHWSGGYFLTWGGFAITTAIWYTKTLPSHLIRKFMKHNFTCRIYTGHICITYKGLFRKHYWGGGGWGISNFHLRNLDDPFWELAESRWLPQRIGRISPLLEDWHLCTYIFHATFTLWQLRILWHHLDTERRDCIVISFHISFYASVAFTLVCQIKESFKHIKTQLHRLGVPVDPRGPGSPVHCR